MEELKRDKLDREWLVVSALKEVINLAEGCGNANTYHKALDLAEVLAPKFFSPQNRILAGAPESLKTQEIRQLALLERNHKGTMITDYQYAIRERNNLQLMINEMDNPDTDVALAKSRLNQLELVVKELTPRRLDESKTIFADFYHATRDLPVSKDGKDYKQFSLDEERALRIHVFHPDTNEYKSGADLLYELLDERKRTARIAIVQYKMWDGKSFHQDPRMIEQLAKMERFCCGSRLCDLRHDTTRSYRLPPCAAFMRPTDRLTDADSKMKSSGLHIPLCVVKDAWEINQNGGKSIRKINVLNRSVSNEVFEELFNRGMLGGKELSYNLLEEHYKAFGIFEDNQSVKIHAQEFEKDVTKKARTRRSADARRSKD